MQLQYCAIFQYAIDGINIFFPDIPNAISCAFSRKEAIYMAKEVLELTLHGKAIAELPTATPKEQIVCDAKTEAISITIVMNADEGILYSPNVKTI